MNEQVSLSDIEENYEAIISSMFYELNCGNCAASTPGASLPEDSGTGDTTVLSSSTGYNTIDSYNTTSN